MQLWSFIFTQPDRRYISARVAAPTKQDACNIMGEHLGRQFFARQYAHPEAGTIMQPMGKLDTDQAGIVSLEAAEEAIA